MILYFTGTGNSRYVARRLGQLLSDNVASINQALKENQTGVYHSDRPLWWSARFTPGSCPEWCGISCCPPGLPAAAASILSSPAAAAWATPRLPAPSVPAEKSGMVRPGAGGDAGKLHRHVPGAQAGQCARIIEKADPLIGRLAKCIKAGLPFPHHAAGPLGRLLSGPVNRLFYRFQVSARGFRVTDACTGCGLCQRLCPLRNIRLEQGRPVWGERCTHCMACICACPAQAIEYKNHSQGKPRYYLK